MGTTYQPPNLAYENTHPGLPGYASALAQADRKRNALSEAQAALTTSYSRPSAVPNQPLTQIHNSQNRYALPSISSQPTSRHSTRPSTPNSGTLVGDHEEGTTRRDSAMVLHSLEIHPCISPKGGNLADFAAQITCLFWFETVQTLQDAEKIDLAPPAKHIRRLNRNAVATQAFKKWVQNILSTTQVAQNVILLGLLFIYRLKATNPGVKGRAGSEYRLLTVALMLGNKFLDDNTYTNKTWAEVSGITVKEIHVMEVEFLSNMRYSLLVSKAEWESWLVKLSKFWEYCDRAMMPHASPLVIPSPAQVSFGSPLASPTGNLLLTPSAHPSPPSTYSPSAGLYANNAQGWPTYHDSSVASPLANKPDLRNAYGKRLMAEEDLTEPPSKRISRQPPGLPSLPSQSLNPNVSIPSTVPEPLRLPALAMNPHLVVNANPQLPTPAPSTTYSSATPYAPQTQSSLSLPPLVPGVRAMATVFPPTTTSFAPQLPMLATSGPSLAPASSAPSGTVTPTTYPSNTYGTPTKRMSPLGSLTPAAAYSASSPMAESFQHVTGVHTPISHSPSIYLQQRNSPYKPVRNFNTLLYPPPTASLHEYRIAGSHVQPNQMHYQPLGRRHEFRTGIVPEFQMPHGGAVERGLPLTPIHGMHMPITTRGPGQTMHAAYPN